MIGGRRRRLIPAVAFILGGCAAPASPPPAPPRPTTVSLARAESAYADLRALRDRIEVTTAAGRRESPDGVPLATLTERYGALRAGVAPGLAAIDSGALAGEDRRALAIMRAALQSDLGPLAPSDPGGGELSAPDCDYDPRAILAGAGGADSLRHLVYACFGWAQQHLRVEGEQLDRITLLGMLVRIDDPERRRRLFLALEPVWRSVDADGGPSSPYRLMLLSGRRPASSVADRARGLGLEPDSLEHWLVATLEAWRAGTPDSLVEPWDWNYLNGRASRVLDPRIPRDRMDSLDAQVFRALGADPAVLHVHYDLAPREGKTPVAYTTFGTRARDVGGTWVPAEPWVFATYLTGGLGYLNELLHETGHAVHLAAIRTRPAFLDWPDSDPFSEALGDFVALDVYEPAWQMRWLGDSVPLADGLRARYAGVVLDVAWALFELELQRSPTADPSQVWTAITRDYLRIRPHPELAWWAMRGQLVDEPGYMMNYAAGAIVIAAIRARTVAQHGPFATGDSTWYAWVAPRLFRFGLERSSREVITDFLGGPVTPAALLEDMGRMRR